MTGRTVSEPLPIEAGENTPCFGCMNRECRIGMGLWAKKPGETPGRSPETGPSSGVLAPKRVLAIQALLVLLPPILGFFSGFVFLGALTGREGLSILGGFMGGFFAALGVYLFPGRSPKKHTPGFGDKQSPTGR
ncbi:MAG: SoxR reducing system RseC family protein [Treponema sp.]|jgi:hypothetical protein|nr:SoxR reducing system RseC family protein [Treponema sp.]